MKAIVITRPGEPDVLQMEERAVPACGTGDVLVKVAASGVNRPDIFQRKGNYPPPAGAPQDIPGLEIAGVVVETGADVTRWKAGDKVCALVWGGGYAGYCVAPEGQCLPVPGNFNMEEAASLPETFFTVWSNVFDRGALKPGEALLVHGGSGGIGVAAIQMAAALGSRVFTTAGSPAKCKFCEELGAVKAINYKTEDFPAVIAALTANKGVNVILDSVGGDYTQKNLVSLAEDGRLVMINAMKSKDVQVDLSLVMRKRLNITGSMLRGRDIAFKSAIAGSLEKNIWPLLVSGKIKPVIDEIFQASNASKAHALMESGDIKGKIVLKWD